MESHQSYLPLLCKFSHGINILPFFGERHQCKLLMQLLCKATNSVWDENQREFKFLSLSKTGLTLTLNSNDETPLLERLKENNKIMRFLIKLHISSPEGGLRLIDTLDSINDIFDVLIDIDFSRKISKSDEFLRLVKYLNEREPDIPIPVPIGFKDKRLKKNPWNIFSRLSYTLRENEIENNAKLMYAIVKGEKSLNFFLFTENRKRVELNFLNGGGRALLNSKFTKRPFLSKYVDTLFFCLNKEESEVLPVESLKFVTSGRFVDEEQSEKLPLFEIQKVALVFCHKAAKSIISAIEVLKFKKEFNLKIEESKSSFIQKPISVVDLKIEVYHELEFIKISKPNCFMFIYTPEQSYGVSCSFYLIIDKNSNVLYSDESLYVLSNFSELELKDSDLVDPSHHVHRRFEELLQKFYAEAPEVPSFFCAFFNYGFDYIKLNNAPEIILPSFRDIQMVKFSIGNLDISKMELLEDISKETTYLYSPSNNKIVKKYNSCGFHVPKIGFLGENIEEDLIGSKLDLFSSLPIIGFNLFEINGSPDQEDPENGSISDTNKNAMKAVLKNPHLKQLKLNDDVFFTLTREKKEALIRNIEKANGIEDLEIHYEEHEKLEIFY